MNRVNRTSLLLHCCFIYALGLFLVSCDSTPSSPSPTSESFSPASLVIETVPEGQNEFNFTAPSRTLYTQIEFHLGTGLTSKSICSGASILGIVGQAQCESVCLDPLRSNRFRNVGTSPLAQSQESHGNLGALNASDPVRDVPQILTDDEGTSNSLVISASYADGACGQSGTLSARIADCANKSNAQWNGAANANQGQGIWDLVSANAHSNYQVWRDNRTQLLWSSVVEPAASWCAAAGNHQTSTPLSCAANPASTCDERGGLSASATAENFTTGHYSAAKGGMGLLSTPKIYWRLPTLHDYRQAEVDGIRFVMPDLGENSTDEASKLEWTATVKSTDRTYAYHFQPHIGLMDATLKRNLSAAVRCIGSYEPN